MRKSWLRLGAVYQAKGVNFGKAGSDRKTNNRSVIDGKKVCQAYHRQRTHTAGISEFIEILLHSERNRQPDTVSAQQDRLTPGRQSK